MFEKCTFIFFFAAVTFVVAKASYCGRQLQGRQLSTQSLKMTRDNKKKRLSFLNLWPVTFFAEPAFPKLTDSPKQMSVFGQVTVGEQKHLCLTRRLIYSVVNYRSKLTDYLPTWVCKSSWSIRGRTPRSSLEHKLLQEYSDVSQRGADVKACHKMFLEICWAFPFYGQVKLCGIHTKRFHSDFAVQYY